MKKILGLDLGTNSIGWAYVNEAENSEEKSSIVKLGVRTISYDNFVSTETGKNCMDAEKDFRGGKGISCNAGRTLKRSMRRNLQRYKLRRENLIEVLKGHGFIDDETILSENGNATTFQTWHLRAKAATEEISLKEFARVLLMINKKRGYKSSRKAKSAEEGQLIDGMDVAKKLYDENLTPGQFVLQLLQAGKKYIPDFYRSDLQDEFDKVWNFQKQFYPEILTDALKENLRDKNEKQTWAICQTPFSIVGIKRETKGEELKKENFLWRTKALSEKMNLEQLAVVLQKINSQLKNSSGYLGAISDRSKELYFNNQTVGQYQMEELEKNPNHSLKNEVFYRQDYLNEFEKIWETQAKYHKELTPELKKEIRDIVIFYQRPLKSQKGLISFCEFESKKIKVEVDGVKKIKKTGSKVCPKSSLLFQEFRIWQRLNNIEIFPANEKQKKRKPNARNLTQDEKEALFNELIYIDELKKDKILELLDIQEYDVNFDKIIGNRTFAKILKVCPTIKDNANYKFNTSDDKVEDQSIFKLWHLLYSYEGDKTPTGVGKLMDKLQNTFGFTREESEKLVKLDFENDYGNLSSKAIKKILPHLKEGEQYDVACVLAGYETHSKSSLTREQIKNKILKDKLEPISKNSLRNPVVEKILNQMINVINAVVDTYGKPDEIRIELARELKKNADERFMLTDSINANTSEIQNLKDEMKDKFPMFRTQEPSRNDVIRYKLWQELTPNAYKPLYGSKENLQKEISPAILFSGEIEIEHILPKARLFDDSFSNKTLVFSSDNKDKGNKTAIDYVKQIEGNLDSYIDRIIAVFGTKITKKIITNPTTKKKSIKIETKTFDSILKMHESSMEKNKTHRKSIEKWDEASEDDRKKMTKPWGRMSDTEKKIEIINRYYSGKLKKLIITVDELPEGFISRDLANTQYITKKAKEILNELVPYVVSTTGAITERLREDWQLVDVMRELNWDKYEKLGLTEIIDKVNYDGKPYQVKQIKDWTKRNDHRHHAMDALTVAFTKRSYIQYLNNLNARRTDENQGISNTDKDDKVRTAITTEDIILNTRDVLFIEQNELYRDSKDKLRFNPPMPLGKFRAEAKRQLENTLISIKAKNKIATRNINKANNDITSEITTKDGEKKTIKGQLTLTPRGQLHNETIYGSAQQYVVKEEKIGGKFDVEQIAKVTSAKYRNALLERLSQFGGDAKKAFTGKNSLDKNPIYLDALHTQKVPEKVKTITTETIYTIRKEIVGSNPTSKQFIPDEKGVQKVIDKKIKTILENRLKEYGGDAKTAFSNLDENPIWLNESKGISIKRVTITGVSNAEPLHDKTNKDRNLILDENNKPQPTDFVSTSNNHHVAIYRDAQGNLQENVVSFYEAMARVNQGLPIIDKTYKQDEGWQFLFTMKQNEYFVFPNEKTGFDPNEIDLLNPDNYALISPNLFRVQTMSKVVYGNNTVRDYKFRHHLETTVQDNKLLKDITYKQYKTLDFANNILKVRVNHIGEIVSVGEY